MSERERMLKLLAATPQQLAQVDAVLDGRAAKDEKPNNKTVTFAEAAKQIGCSRPSVYKMVEDGQLKAVVIGMGARRITQRSINDLIAGRTTTPAAVAARAENIGAKRLANLTQYRESVAGGSAAAQ